jgi:hypothetical protein
VCNPCPTRIVDGTRQTIHLNLTRIDFVLVTAGGLYAVTKGGRNLKTSTRTQYIALCIMFAVLVIMVSLMPMQESKDTNNMAAPGPQVTNVGMIKNTDKQFQN